MEIEGKKVGQEHFKFFYFFQYSEVYFGASAQDVLLGTKKGTGITDNCCPCLWIWALFKTEIQFSDLLKSVIIIAVSCLDMGKVIMTPLRNKSCWVFEIIVFGCLAGLSYLIVITTLWRWVLLFSLFCRCQNWGLENWVPHPRSHKWQILELLFAPKSPALRAQMKQQ